MPRQSTYGHLYAVTRRGELTCVELNSSMRQIDLFCKLFAPVFISLLDGLSTRIAVWVVFGLNVVSVFVEYGAIAQVCTLCLLYMTYSWCLWLPLGIQSSPGTGPKSTNLSKQP